MIIMNVVCFLLPIFITGANSANILYFLPNSIEISVNERQNVLLKTEANLTQDVQLVLKRLKWFDATPTIVILDKTTKKANLTITGIEINSHSLLEIEKCNYVKKTDVCPFDELDRTSVDIKIVHSLFASKIVIIVGWIYFFAWSISFYPQIILNYQRKSVVGLHFDFLALNIVGFACYSVYNILMYFSKHIQDLYLEDNPYKQIPVLLNDVIFAVHAFIVCIFTLFQCFIYERGQQRVSHTCMALLTAFCLFALVSVGLNLFSVINALKLITFLSYIKMAVTCSKYVPQTYYNYKRKSTIGWSIGNILLDFVGGSMDICQMVLQSFNSDDWSTFTGNPVKFGLGLVSMLFDMVFMVQHYVLYRKPANDIDVEDTSAASSRTLEFGGDASWTDCNDASVIKVTEHPVNQDQTVSV